MFTTYEVVEGDTYERISRKVYGTGTEALRIQRANPGVRPELLQEGVLLTIPTSPLGPVDRRSELPASSFSEVAIRIDGKRFRYWESVRIVRAIDSFDTVELTAPFDISLPGFRETFQPFTYKEIDITVGGSLLFTGTLVSVLPKMTKDAKAVVASGYSLPGVLNDCTPPASAFPLEFENQNLQAIAETIAGTFGLSVEFEADPGAIFKRVVLNPGKKSLAFLADLTKQRNMVIGNTEPGALLFRRPTGDGAPVADLRQGVPPLTDVASQFSPQNYYSDITGIEPVFYGLGGSQFTVRNPRLPGVLRPVTFDIPDTESAAVPDAVNSKMGRMFANAIAYRVSVATMHDQTGAVWSPGSVVTLEAPGAMVYSKYPFMVRSVGITRTRTTEKADLGLVLPGSFAGEVPEALPWD